MTRKQLKDSDILRKARRLIESFKVDHVCVAIGQAAGRRHRERGNRLVAWVEKMLGGHLYYSWWLKSEHPDVHKQLWEMWQTNGRRGSPWRAGRLNWLDWMIAECEKEETLHG